VAADHRSIHPNIPGVPWWAGVVIAVTAAAVGFAFDAGSGNKQLTNVFGALYGVGCVLAVLVVRQSGVFSAVIQPPLILFFSVPGAYWLFHGAKVTGIKDILINCGYPLIERFPLMMFTSAGVLLIGMVRWYFGMTRRMATTAKTKAGAATADARKPGIIARLASVGSPDSAGRADEAPVTGSQPAHAVGRSPKSARPASSGRPTKRPAPTRSRHVRPPLDDKPEPTVERPGRRRTAPARDYDYGYGYGYGATAEPPAPRRRPGPPRDPDLRGQPPREIRRDPQVRRSPYERPTTRSSRFDPYEPMEAPEPIQPYEPQRRRPASSGANGVDATHHPISRVRYRGAARDDEPPAGSRSRRPHQPDAESWEYDI
jgi:hypothetical protein